MKTRDKDNQLIELLEEDFASVLGAWSWSLLSGADQEKLMSFGRDWATAKCSRVDGIVHPDPDRIELESGGVICSSELRRLGDELCRVGRNRAYRASSEREKRQSLLTFLGTWFHPLDAQLLAVFLEFWKNDRPSEAWRAVLGLADSHPAGGREVLLAALLSEGLGAKVSHVSDVEADCKVAWEQHVLVTGSEELDRGNTWEELPENSRLSLRLMAELAVGGFSLSEAYNLGFGAGKWGLASKTLKTAMEGFYGAVRKLADAGVAPGRGRRKLSRHVALLWNWAQGDELIVPYGSLDPVFSAKVLIFLESIDLGQLGDIEERWCRLSRSLRIKRMSDDAFVNADSTYGRLDVARTLWDDREGSGSFGRLGEAEARVVSLLVDKLSASHQYNWQANWLSLLAQAAEDTWKRLPRERKRAALGGD